VLGGAGLVMFGMVAATGIRILSTVDYKGNRHNLYIVALSIGFGLIPLVAPRWTQQMAHSLHPLLESRHPADRGGGGGAEPVLQRRARRRGRRRSRRRRRPRRTDLDAFWDDVAAAYRAGHRATWPPPAAATCSSTTSPSPTCATRRSARTAAPTATTPTRCRAPMRA
jgi:hypothetical protein